MEESVSRRAEQLIPLAIGNVVQVQNQTGKDLLCWNRDGRVVESLENQHYRVNIDG